MDLSGPMAAVVNASHNGIMILDRDGIVVFYNTTASRIFNEIPGEILGKHFSALRPEAWPDIKRVLETGQPQIGRRFSLPKATIIVNRRKLPCQVDS